MCQPELSPCKLGDASAEKPPPHATCHETYNRPPPSFNLLQNASGVEQSPTTGAAYKNRVPPKQERFAATVMACSVEHKATT